MNRRDFACATGVLALAGLPAGATATTAPPCAKPAAHARPMPGLQAWRSRIGQGFEFGTRGSLQRLTLTDVQVLPAAPGLEQFTLVFDAPHAAAFETLVDLRDADGHGWQLFLEPAGAPGRQLASFSLLV